MTDPKVLIIDDEEGVREYLRSILEDGGYSVAEAINGENAMTMFEERNFHVVFSDIMMPVKDGLETIIELKKRKPNVHVVAMSGAENKDHLLSLADLYNVDFVIKKPFTKQEVLFVMYQFGNAAGPEKSSVKPYVVRAV